ncbi:putative F-box protein At2g02030 [Mercurialis annua]|uniref:putative F-box protein At2g02030 n=1 Tax=Mercurialis annua TaxID=3986 RepID=UPI00215E5776|nr:putative F-box protein At2g02030 [Mercurialis annua]
MKQQIISDDVIESIFLKLPAKSILQFRSISKYWNSVLTSPGFVATHRHLHHSQYCLLFVEDDSINVVQYVGLQQNDPVAVFTTRLSFPPPLQIFPSSWRDNSGRLYNYCGWKTGLFSSCNGILCIDMIGDLHNDTVNHGLHTFMCDHVTVLWNPCTNAFRELPKSGGYPKTTMDGRLAYLGFVYDSSNNDYKVIKVEHYFEGSFRSAVDIFSLKSNMWTSIADNIEFPYRIGDEATVINGGLYWLERDTETLDLETYQMLVRRGRLEYSEDYMQRIRTREKLFRFDFTTKLSTEQELPHMGENYNSYETQAFASLASDYLSLFTNNGDLWLLKDGSWVKHMTIPRVFQNEIGVDPDLMPLFFTKDNSIVTHAEGSTKSSVQVTYDPHQSSFKIYKVHGIQHSYRIILHNQTLVSPSIF